MPKEARGAAAPLASPVVCGAKGGRYRAQRPDRWESSAGRRSSPQLSGLFLCFVSFFPLCRSSSAPCDHSLSCTEMNEKAEEPLSSEHRQSVCHQFRQAQDDRADRLKIGEENKDDADDGYQPIKALVLMFARVGKQKDDRRDEQKRNRTANAQRVQFQQNACVVLPCWQKRFSRILTKAASAKNTKKVSGGFMVSSGKTTKGMRIMCRAASRRSTMEAAS